MTHRANGGAIYLLPDRLVEEFDLTDCDEVLLQDLQLPFPNLYLRFKTPAPLFLETDSQVDGCLVVKQGDDYLFSLTTRRNNVDYDRSLSVACVDPVLGLNLPSKIEGLESVRIVDAVEQAIDAFIDDNAPPVEDLSEIVKIDGAPSVQIEDVRAVSRARRLANFEAQETVFRSCLNIIVNSLCFISFRPSDVSEEFDPPPPPWMTEAVKSTETTRRVRDRRDHANRIFASGEYVRLRVCGRSIFGSASERGKEQSSGLTPRAHWRRGHWRRQRHGVSLSLVTPVWIRPTLVNADNGHPADARIYSVDDETNSS